MSQAHVEWTFSYDGQRQAIIAEANIDKGWHLYSQEIINEFGPIPTEFVFKESESYELVGSTEEPDPIKEYDPNFEGEMHFFKDNATFVQKVKASKESIIEGTVTYMVCNDSMCMPPVDVEFSIKVENEK